MEGLGANTAAADCIPEVLMLVAAKSGIVLQKVMATEFIGADDGSWWA